MLPQEKMRWVGQTTYEKYRQRGFQEGCLDRVVLFGIKLEKLPKDFSIRESRLYECRMNGMALNKLNLGGCVITDCIFDSLQIKELNAAGTSVHGTVFFGDRFGSLDFRDAELNHSIIQDCDIDCLHMDRALLNGARFYRIKHQAVTGRETVRITPIGGTEEETENYRQKVKAAIF